MWICILICECVCKSKAIFDKIKGRKRKTKSIKFAWKTSNDLLMTYEDEVITLTDRPLFLR